MTASTASIPTLAPLAASTRMRSTGLVMAVASALAFSSSGPFIKPLLESGWSLGAAWALLCTTAAHFVRERAARALSPEGRG